MRLNARDFRKQYREEKRRNKELQEQLARTSGSAKLQNLAKSQRLRRLITTPSDMTELAAWYERKRKHTTRWKLHDGPRLMP